MAVASTPLVAAPSCPAWAKRRRGRQPQFDGKPCEPAEEEDMWLCLADGRARSTADLKRLATAARVRAKRAGDAAAANTRDRQARDQRRRQREQHDRRAAPAVAKTVRPQRGQCGCPAHAVCGMCVDQGKLAAAEQAAIDLETRFHASTNVVMDLERPEDETAALLQRCVHVSDETKRRLLGEWSDERMAHALPLHACASCGVRDPSLTYTRVDVSALPRTVSVRVAGGEDETRHVFELSPEQCAKYRGLQNKKVRLAFPNGASNSPSGRRATPMGRAFGMPRARRTLRASLPSEAQRTDANGAVAPAPRAQERSRPHPQPGRPSTRVTERVTSRCATHQTRRTTVQACPRVSKSVKFGGGCSVPCKKNKTTRRVVKFRIKELRC